MRSRLRRLTKQRRARQWHQLPRRRRQAPCPARRRTERRQGLRQQRLIQHSSRQPGAPIRKGSGSFGINAKYPRGIGPNYGDLMPAPDRIKASVFTVLQTSMSDTYTLDKDKCPHGGIAPRTRGRSSRVKRAARPPDKAGTIGDASREASRKLDIHRDRRGGRSPGGGPLSPPPPPPATLRAAG